MLYVESAAFKESVSIPDTATDADVTMALGAASRAVERVTNRKKFWKDTSPVTQKYTAYSTNQVFLDDDVVQINQVTVDGVTVTDYLPEPLNAAAEGEPYTWLSSDSCVFTSTKRGGIQVTGLFGWPAIPDEVRQMVTILAARLLMRTRQAPFGIVTVGSIDSAAVQLARTDPEMALLVGPLTRQEAGVA